MLKRFLIMASNGFEEDELFVPLELLRSRGCKVAVAAPGPDPIRATVLDRRGKFITPDVTIADARQGDHDALLLPGGLINPDHLRGRSDAVGLVRRFAGARKPIGAICHGPWLLIEANLLRGKRATSWPSIRTDLRNAGAQVTDGPVETDGQIVTAVGPTDSAAFAEALLAATER
ncbi:MAG TPA: DJ-1/PfpI/YhbO family deglycase/protease [Sphingomicrobium sp.]|nr:DJ-1/PfpI/YhbO family deglycase/protease [Sphingomicrobium sp.]